MVSTFSGEKQGLKLESTFSGEEQNLLMSRLWLLLKEQTEQYNGGDSTSIRLEKAQDILESLWFTITVAMEEGATKQEILEGNLRAILRTGQSILARKKTVAEIEWKFLKEDLPRIHNDYLRDTVRNLGTFFRSYNIEYAAHDIPCSIDYWLLCPVSEERKGIRFVEEYVRHLQMEMDFLHCFDRERLILLYRKSVRDYKNVLFNLCDPPLDNAIALAIIGLDVRSLSVSQFQREQLLKLLRYKSHEELQDIVERATVKICQSIGMNSREEMDYFVEASRGLAVRLYEPVKNEDLSSLFVTL